MMVRIDTCDNHVIVMIDTCDNHVIDTYNDRKVATALVGTHLHSHVLQIKSRAVWDTILYILSYRLAVVTIQVSNKLVVTPFLLQYTIYRVRSRYTSSIHSIKI